MEAKASAMPCEVWPFSFGKFFVAKVWRYICLFVLTLWGTCLEGFLDSWQLDLFGID